MKRSVFILLFIALFSFLGKGQVYFNNEYTNDSSNTNSAHIVYEFPDTSGYLLIGSFGIPGYKAMVNLTRLDLYGDTIWNKYYRTRMKAQGTNGGNVISIGDTNLIFAGLYAQETSDSVHVNVIKMDTAGNVIWDYIFGDIGKQTPANDIALTKDGGFIITGFTNGWGAPSAVRSFLLKLDSAGNEEWHNYYFIPGSTADEGISIDTTDDYGYMVTGIVYKATPSNNADLYMMRVDSGGNQVWSKSFGSPYFDVNRCYVENIGGDEYLIAGGIMVDNGNGQNRQYYLAKFEGSAGNIIWADTSGIDQLGIDEQLTTAPIVTYNGDIVVTGGVEPPVGVSATVHRYTSSGTKLWERTFNKYGSNNQNYLWDIEQTHDKGFIACGQFTNLSIPEGPYWALKLDSLGCDTINCSVGISELDDTNDELVLYPNPTNGAINIESEKVIREIEIFDLIGKRVYYEVFSDSYVNFNPNLMEGVYLLRVKTEKGVLNRRIVVN